MDLKTKNTPPCLFDFAGVFWCKTSRGEWSSTESAEVVRVFVACGTFLIVIMSDSLSVPDSNGRTAWSSSRSLHAQPGTHPSAPIRLHMHI